MRRPDAEGLNLLGKRQLSTSIGNKQWMQTYIQLAFLELGMTAIKKDRKSERCSHTIGCYKLRGNKRQTAKDK